MTRRAITPIEVLLSIAVVVSATAALAPLHTQDDPAKRTVCLKNVKLVCTAIAIYEADYDDHVPLAKKWMDLVKPYTKNEAFYHCTEVGTKAYGYALSSAAAGKNVEKIANPATEVLLFDSTVLTRSAVSTLKSLPKPGRHEGKNNIGYIDTHAKSVAR